MRALHSKDNVRVLRALFPRAVLIALGLLGANASFVHGQAFVPSERLSIAPSLGAIKPVGYFNEYFDANLGFGLRLSYDLNADVALVANARLDTFNGSW